VKPNKKKGRSTHTHNMKHIGNENKEVFQKEEDADGNWQSVGVHQYKCTSCTRVESIVRVFKQKNPLKAMKKGKMLKVIKEFRRLVRNDGVGTGLTQAISEKEDSDQEEDSSEEVSDEEEPSSDDE
jgi:cell division protein FtsL